MTYKQQQALGATGCEVREDNLTRQLYATDASIYQIVPLCVAFPRTPDEAGAVIHAAAESGLAIIPRGAGTGLVGGAIGEGLVIDFSRHLNGITQFSQDKKTVQVGPGVVLDHLNAFLQSRGFTFGPDVATSSRATLGGMIANNSSGARVPIYGTTADHVKTLDIILADGSQHQIGPAQGGLGGQTQFISELIEQHRNEIQDRLPPGLAKRWPGYGLDRWLQRPGNLTDILAGSEGTLAAIVSAELSVMPLPKRKGLGLLFFDSMAEAMQATVELLDLKPAAIEHIDRILFDQTRGQHAFRAARDLLELDTKPCESILIVEFHEEVDDSLSSLEKRAMGRRQLVLKGQREMNLVWGLRKAGLSLLTGRAGSAKPTTGIEDTAVPTKHLPAYVEGLQEILQRRNLEACFYGHAATGLLHVRPVLDLHQAEDVEKFREVADEVSALVRQFKGSLSAEHGVGIARTEYLEEHLGADLMEAHRRIKGSFDPRNIFNPGKVVDDGQYRIDRHLRQGAGYELDLPFTPVLAFAAKDRSFVANLEQCNGCGGCRKETPTMCPTFMVTGEEILSTRGRANAIRAALERRGLDGEDPLLTKEMEEALSNCLSCKACTAECPSNVNLSLLKAELLYARHRKYGVPLRARMVGAVDRLGRLGCLMPGLANAALQHPWIRKLMTAMLGLDPRRTLPPYAEERFDAWFAKRQATATGNRGRVILWDDTFVRYHEPNIGRAAVTVLEAAGYEVILPRGRQCCGRPAFSQGHLDPVRGYGKHNLELLSRAYPDLPILFLEPSCYAMFKEDYRELKLDGAEPVAGRCYLFEEFIQDLLESEPDALAFSNKPESIAIHVHCHTKALLQPQFMVRLLQHLPGRDVTLLQTACCGMAGAFGMVQSKYDLSLQVAGPLVNQIAAQPADSLVAASGTSCRHQIDHLTPKHPYHTAEILAEALREMRPST